MVVRDVLLLALMIPTRDCVIILVTMDTVLLVLVDIAEHGFPGKIAFIISTSRA
jgi:hypothetical protein